MILRYGSSSRWRIPSFVFLRLKPTCWPERHTCKMLHRLAILASPPLLFLLLGLPWYSMNLFQDAVFFHGILADPAEHLRRFGATYYNVRFGAIIPEAALWRLLGSEA